MSGKFELLTSDNGEFHYNLKAGNGQVILTSQQYGSKGAALNGIAAVRTNAPLDERYEKAEAESGEAYFNLRAANDQVVGTSQMYSSKTGRNSGIDSVKSNAPKAAFEDLT